MTNEQKIKAIAELDGWKPSGEPYPSMTDGEDVQWYRKAGDLEDITTLPDYLNSHDAILPVIRRQSITVKEQIAKQLGCKHDYCAWIDATPEQLTDALLKATGKWIEI